MKDYLDSQNYKFYTLINYAAIRMEVHMSF